MAGREDFAIIRARFLSDERAHTAASLYVERGVAHHATALACVVGHIAMLGVLASRDTDDGILTPTQITVATMSFGCPPDVRRTITECLIEAGLLREVGDGTLYLVGFTDCYADLIRRRKRDRRRKREARARDDAGEKAEASSGRPADVQRMSGGTGPDRTGPDRTGSPPSPPPGGEPPEGGEESRSTFRVLRPRDRERYGRVLEYVIRCGVARRDPAGRSIAVARERRDELREGRVGDAEIAARLATDYGWVTPERLARWKDGAA